MPPGKTGGFLWYIMPAIQTERVNNLSKWLQRIKWKLEHQDKKCETCGIN